MYIQVTKNDCIKIVNENLQGGGSKNTPLEIAMAKSILKLHERLGQINNERNEYFEAIYSASIKFEKATKGTLKHKRAADLARDSKAHFAAAVKLDSELKGLFDNDAKEKI